MDEKTDGVLHKILTSDELTQVPNKIKEKIDDYFKRKFEEFLIRKAEGETAKATLDEVRDTLEQEVINLKSQIQDFEAKFRNSQQNVDELRQQLDVSRSEINKLLESVKKFEAEANECRREKNMLADERDSLLKMNERRNAEVERLQSDLKSLEQQLKAAVHAKCEALAKIDEIQAKEVALDFKEKRMEQERTILTSQIQSLTEDLNRNNSELHTIRRDNTIRNLELDTKLNEKTEELKICNSQIAHINETVGVLTAKAEDLAAKLLQQSEESNKMMEYYKKELHAKAKLADLYKETNEDKVNQINELSNAITDLKKMLSEATEQYGELETKLKAVEVKHEQELEEKNNIIQSIRDELKNANDLLKESQNENLENAIGKLAPTAAVTSKLIKSDMSLTELYSKYVKAVEDLQSQEKENQKLNLTMKSIMQELEENAPIIRRQALDYQKVLEANQELQTQLEKLITEKVDNKHDMDEALRKVGHLERENKKLKVSQADLARQVCYLLGEVEQARGGLSMDKNQSLTADATSDEVISKRLVTFNSINELQENNQKLLLLVRDLSSKLEEMEEVQNSIDQASYETKINNYSKRLNEMQQSLEHQSEMLTISMQKCERYKKLYYDALKLAGKSGLAGSANQHHPDGSVESDNMDGIDEETPIASTSSVISNEISNKEKRISELEDLVKELKEQLKNLKQEHEDYIKEKKVNEKMLNEQFDSMRTEVRELTSKNCQLMSQVQYNNEQIKLAQKNAGSYKKQISSLEERNKNYESTIIKHEQTIIYLKDETLNAQKKLSHAEVQLQNLRQECRILKDAETRLQMERDALHRERQTQSLLMNNLEMIKASFERSESEGRIRLESRLDEANRECSALRRRLQEEQDNFRELTVDLKRQTDTAKSKMEEEKSIADKLREEIKSLRNEIKTKSLQVDELSKKLQESLTPSKNDNPIVQANKKARDFELKYEEAKLELESLQKTLEQVREHSNQYCKLSQSSEKELADLSNAYSEYKTNAESELNRLKMVETTLKSRVEELETEIQLQITDAQLSTGTTHYQVKKVQNELKETLQKLSESNRELRDLREKNNILTASLQAAQQKYANELASHTSDIQELVQLREEVLKVREQITVLTSQRDKAVSVLEETKLSFIENEKRVVAEKEQIEKRLIDLDAQNALLHNEIQALSLKLSSAAAAGNQILHEESISENSTVCDSSLLNKSITDDHVGKYSDKQLLQIIKYLRKEKDIAFAKVDILKSENNRLISEQQILQKRIEELNSLLNTERTQSESTLITATRHQEILRKVETLNAVTDSNRILREERDALSNRVKELLERVTKVEDELFPLQEENRELKSKVEEFTAEITSLRTEAVKWRSRANTLIEKSNKNPEEFKRIQNERESLAKMLTAEKETIRHLQEEIQTLRNDKTKVDADIQGLVKQICTVNEDKKRVTDELNSIKQINSRLNHEIMDLKNNVLQREEETRKASEEINAKESQLNDCKNKEVQIRKIAKKYKDLYFELKTKTDGFAEGESTTNANDIQPASETSTSGQDDKDQKDKINELNNQLKTLEEEADRLRKENEEIKSNAEKEDRTKNLLREAKIRIVSLTEAKNSVTQELNTTKTQLQTLSQSLEQEYVTRISQLEKALNEQDNQLKETISRLTRENENLSMRVGHLNRQLGLQQSSKPSTSSGTGSEKGPGESPRTANVKPMAGPSGQQSATVTPWRGSSGETPLASIRPMSVSQNSRTAAILPTSQTGNVSAVSLQGTSSTSTSAGGSSSATTASVTALVPPQQQCHTTAGNNSGEAMSSSPTSSHTDYMPATSSAAVIVATIPPLSSAESSQEAESIQHAQSNADNAAASTSSSSSSTQQIIGQQQQQAVALVSPRVEGNQNIVTPQIIIAAGQSQQEVNNQQPSTSGTSGNISVSSHHQASSSNTVTTTQAGTGHKRPRTDIEGDSSSTTEETPEKSQPQNKRTRLLQAGEATASLSGVSESGLEVEYQVPTSSQRDQEDDIIIVDSEEEGDETDDGNADIDDGPMEDEADDNVEGYEIEGYIEQDIDENEAAGGPNIDEINAEDNNEVEVDEENSSQIPNQSAVAADAGSSTSQMAPAEQSGSTTTTGLAGSTSTSSTSTTTSTTNIQNQVDKEGTLGQQQIQAISSGSSEAATAGSSAEGISQTSAGWRQNTLLSRQQQQTLLMLQQGINEEAADDCIIPSTPTLYAAKRSDGDAVSSPHPAQVPSAARFTFAESGGNISMASEADDSSGVISEETGVTPRSIPAINPQQVAASDSSQNESASTSEVPQNSVHVMQDQEPVAGPSNSVEIEETSNTLVATEEEEDMEDEINESASQSEVQDLEQHANEESEMEEGEGMDGVSSEGEKTAAGTEELEEGREAEATTTPSINTRSRSIRGANNSRKSAGRGATRAAARPTPIVWSDGSPRGAAVGSRSPQRGNYPATNQRNQRARRMRRQSGPCFGRY
ncbi:nucleoprotein TPR [Condylostylus longicornis]|uniref:nucleoprotein TPR n=1 Tax=Condylostylus longicornis TaxID=2530218 RepID=UPI00244DFD8A|nr:nucleoprotein TPR [Condylostylus longicornis]